MDRTEVRWMAVVLGLVLGLAAWDVAVARVKLTTLPLRELGAHFGGVGPAAVSNIVRQATGDPRAARRLAALKRTIIRQAER